MGETERGTGVRRGEVDGKRLWRVGGGGVGGKWEGEREGGSEGEGSGREEGDRWVGEVAEGRALTYLCHLKEEVGGIRWKIARILFSSSEDRWGDRQVPT